VRGELIPPLTNIKIIVRIRMSRIRGLTGLFMNIYLGIFQVLKMSFFLYPENTYCLNQDTQDLRIYRIFYEYLSGDISGFKDEFFSLS
jgi:hypothetical protein